MMYGSNVYMDKVGESRLATEFVTLIDRPDDSAV